MGFQVEPVDVSQQSVPARLVETAARLAYLPAAARPAGLRGARHHSGWMATWSPRRTRSRTRRAQRRFADVEGRAGLVQTRAEFSIASDGPSVLVNDITFAQMIRHDWRGLRSLPQRLIRAQLGLEREAYHAVTACCAESRWVARSMIEDHGVPPEKVHVVGAGAHPIARPLDRDWSTPRFLFIGHDWDRKNGGLLPSFRRLRQDVPGARLDLVGEHPRVDEDGVTGHGVIRRDDQEGRQRIGSLLEQATCLLMPSDIEPFGIAYVEAGLAGVPSIGTTLGGAADAIGEGGLLVPPRDPEKLLAAMRRLSNPETAQCLGEAARKNASLFSWELVTERIVRVLAPAGVDVEHLARPL